MSNLPPTSGASAPSHCASVEIEFALEKCGEGVGNWPSQVRMTVDPKTLAKLALAKRLVQGLDEVGTSMTIMLPQVAEFTEEGAPWLPSDVDEADGDEADFDTFNPSSYWLTIDNHGLSLSIWEKHSDMTLDGFKPFAECPEFMAAVAMYDEAAAGRLQALVDAPMAPADVATSSAVDRPRGG